MTVLANNAYERRQSLSIQTNGYFNASLDANVINVLPGGCKTTASDNDLLVTTLGSCISACIRDPHTGFGGMNHFMLPDGTQTGAWSRNSDRLRYGIQAMDVLINNIIQSGCAAEDLEIKVFGGANVISGKNLVGTANTDFVLDYLADRKLVISAQDLGGANGRRIHYCPATGKVNRLLLRRKTDAIALKDMEDRYQRAAAHFATAQFSAGETE